MIKSTPTTMGDTAEYSKLTLNGRKVAKLYDSESGVFTPTTQDSYHPLHIGVFGNGGASGYLDGDIAEVLIFDKILDADETTKVTLFSEKWNLTATVDSDGDGFSDALEIANGSIATDSSSTPANIPAVIAESKLWLDATNIDGQNKDHNRW